MLEEGRLQLSLFWYWYCVDGKDNVEKFWVKFEFDNDWCESGSTDEVGKEEETVR